MGIAALIAGFALFAIGTFAGSTSDNSPDELSTLNTRALHPAVGRITTLRGISAAIGVLLMGVLTFRLLAGSESGLDLLLWLFALCALAAPLIRRTALSLELPSFPRGRYADVAIVTALVSIFIALNAHDLTDWYYSAIGDEYAFYNHARELAENGLRRPFDLDGVYGAVEPVMASIYPALIMRLVGIDNFGWKFSLIVSAALTIPGVYILGHVLAGRVAAFVSSAILASSHYIFAFVHSGYPNTDVLPIIVWSIALFVLGIRRNNHFLIYASGLLAGFGLLINIVARAAIAVIVLFALGSAGVRRRIAALWPWALGVSLTVVPLLLVNGGEVVLTAFGKMVGPGSQHASEYEGILSQVTANALRNLLAFNYSSQTSHYVSGALMDPISAALAILGLGYCVGTIHKSSSRLLLILFAVLATGTALLSPYPNVPITRMPSMVIPLSLMAGLAAAYLISLSTNRRDGEKAGLQPITTAAILAILAAAVLALNAWQFWYATPKVFHHTQEALAIGALHSQACAGESDRVVMIGRGTVPLLKPALESYYPDGASPHLLDHSDVKPGMILPASEPKCVIFLNPDDADIQKFMQQLPAGFPRGEYSTFSSPSGKASVEVFSPSGN